MVGDTHPLLSNLWRRLAPVVVVPDFGEYNICCHLESFAGKEEEGKGVLERGRLFDCGDSIIVFSEGRPLVVAGTVVSGSGVIARTNGAGGGASSDSSAISMGTSAVVSVFVSFVGTATAPSEVASSMRRFVFAVTSYSKHNQVQMDLNLSMGGTAFGPL